MSPIPIRSPRQGQKGKKNMLPEKRTTKRDKRGGEMHKWVSKVGGGGGQKVKERC